MNGIWILSANVTAGRMQEMAARAAGHLVGVTQGVWSSVAAGGGQDGPPEWMARLQRQLQADGISHELHYQRPGR